MESIEQLRKDVDMCTQMAGVENKFETVWITKSALLKDIDAIECEVEERYIELPKDINGVPIHVGDKVCTKLGSTYTVARITREDYECTTTWYIEDFASHYSLVPEDLTICKPPTVEDVLNELCTKAFHSRQPDAHVRYKDVIAEYAKRLQLREE